MHRFCTLAKAASLFVYAKLSAPSKTSMLPREARCQQCCHLQGCLRNQGPIKSVTLSLPETSSLLKSCQAGAAACLLQAG